jgi:L-rhamnose mutarotase
VIGIKPERIAEYKKTHAAVWPEVLAKISDCNMRNYNFPPRGREPPVRLLRVSRRGLGGGRSQDGGRPSTQEWWAIPNPMQALDSRNEGDWWAMAGGGVSHRLSSDNGDFGAYDTLPAQRDCGYRVNVCRKQ